MTAGRVDQPQLGNALRDHETRIRQLEAVRPGSFSGRLSWGQLFNDGSVIDAGSGDWSVVFDGVNRYTITFSPAFGALPTVLPAPNDDNPAGAGGGYFTKVDAGSVTLASVDVVTTDLVGDPADGGFNFIAAAAS